MWISDDDDEIGWACKEAAMAYFVLFRIFGNITSKSEMMTFLGQNPVSCKIIVDNKCLQQVKNFKYLISFNYIHFSHSKDP